MPLDDDEQDGPGEHVVFGMSPMGGCRLLEPPSSSNLIQAALLQCVASAPTLSTCSSGNAAAESAATMQSMPGPETALAQTAVPVGRPQVVGRESSAPEVSVLERIRQLEDR